MALYLGLSIGKKVQEWMKLETFLPFYKDLYKSVIAPKKLGGKGSCQGL
jgi:hypothetical protein